MTFALRWKKFASWTTKNLSSVLSPSSFAESSDSKCGSAGTTRCTYRRPLSAPGLSFIREAGLTTMAPSTTAPLPGACVRFVRPQGHSLPHVLSAAGSTTVSWSFSLTSWYCPVTQSSSFTWSCPFNDILRLRPKDLLRQQFLLDFPQQE